MSFNGGCRSGYSECNLGRESGDGVLALALGTTTPRTYVRGYGEATAYVTSLVRAGSGVIAGALGTMAPRQSEVATIRTKKICSHAALSACWRLFQVRRDTQNRVPPSEGMLWRGKLLLDRALPGWERRFQPPAVDWREFLKTLDLVC